jgi:hypothetical protein
MEASMASKPKMYAVKLDLAGYRDFAQWITNSDRYKDPPGSLKPLVEAQLQAQGADVYEECDASARKFNATDKVIPQRDSGRKLNISLPVEICKKSDGSIDLGYLETYVTELKDPGVSVQDGAWALLGMYFLSRCR